MIISIVFLLLAISTFIASISLLFFLVDESGLLDRFKKPREDKNGDTATTDKMGSILNKIPFADKWHGKI